MAANAELVRITVNGEGREVSAAISMQALLDSLQVAGQAGVAVLRNGDVVRKADWPATALEPGDALEIVRATVGG